MYVLPHAVQFCVCAIALVGTVTVSLHVDVHVEYLPLQHKPPKVDVPWLEESHLQDVEALH